MITAQRLLCPIDFSPCSRRAVQVASALARRSGARVTVLNVGKTINLYPALVAQVNPVPVAHPTRAERASEVAHVIESCCDGRHPVDIVLEEGDVAATITAAIGAHQIDLVVMGTHGRRSLHRLVAGSIAHRVVHTAPCPVIVIPPEPAPLPTLAGFGRIVCGGAEVDLSFARRVAENAASHIEAVPRDAPASEVVRRAALAGADLIVWNRTSGAVEDILDRATLPVLVVSDHVPRAWLEPALRTCTTRASPSPGPGPAILPGPGHL